MFVDTAGWASACDRSQTWHAEAEATVRQARDDGIRLVTTNYVLVELISLLTSPMRISRQQQVPFLAAIRQASWVEVVHVDPALDAKSWRLWESRPDKSWSLVDCTSFVLMQERKIGRALTSDHHFEQAGFVRLLK